ncbi:MAG: zf-HC2 domain-containing protein [Planctomycetota bacterium]
MIFCDDVRPWLAPWVDGVLPPAEKVSVEVHLAECLACRAEAEEIRALAGRLRTALADQKLPADFAASVTEHLDEAGRRELLRPAGTPGGGAGFFGRRVWVAAYAAAAAILVVLALEAFRPSRPAPVAPARGPERSALRREPVSPNPPIEVARPGPLPELPVIPEEPANREGPVTVAETPADGPETKPAPPIIKEEVVVAPSPAPEEAILPRPSEPLPSPGETETARAPEPAFATPAEAVRRGGFTTAVAGMDLLLIKLGVDGPTVMLQIAFDNPNEAVTLAALEKLTMRSPGAEDILVRKIIGLRETVREKRLPPDRPPLTGAAAELRRKYEALVIVPPGTRDWAPDRMTPDEIREIGILHHLAAFNDDAAREVLTASLGDSRFFIAQVSCRELGGFVARNPREVVAIRDLADTLVRGIDGAKKFRPVPGEEETPRNFGEAERFAACRVLAQIALSDRASRAMVTGCLKRVAARDPSAWVRGEVKRLLDGLDAGRKAPDMRIWRESDIPGGDRDEREREEEKARADELIRNLKQQLQK